MSNFVSVLSLNSTRDESHFPVSEKAKLVSLVKTWRLKHDKVLASAQHYRDVIDTLKGDIERLQEEKDVVTTHLTSQLERDRASYELTIKKLRTEVETARNGPEIEAKALREKLNRLQQDTQPIVQFYKKRNEEMEDKINRMKTKMESLEEDNERMVAKVLEVEEDTRIEMAKIMKENGDLKTRYQEQIGRIRSHCTSRLAGMRTTLVTKQQDEIKEAVASFAKKYDDLKAHFNMQISAMRKQLEKDAARDKSVADSENSQKLHSLAIGHASEMQSLQRKLELEKSRLRESKKNFQEIEATVALNLEKLKKSRMLYLNPLAKGDGTESKIMTSSGNRVPELLQELKKQKKCLLETQEKLLYSDKTPNADNSGSMLTLEVAFTERAFIVEDLKNKIRRYQSHTIKPVTKQSPNDEQAITNKSSKIRKIQSPKKYPKIKNCKPLDSGRDKWLFVRQLSTVQYLATENGRERWLNNEQTRRY